MSKRVSELYGMDIYTTKAAYVGTVEDVILNLEKGEVMRLSLKPFKGGVMPGEVVKQILTSESIPYSDVIEVGEIILVETSPVKSRAL